MSQKEMGRLEVIQKVVDKQIRQADAGHQLGLSTRQGIVKLLKVS